MSFDVRRFAIVGVAFSEGAPSLRLILALVLLRAFLVVPASLAQSCAGDCDGDGSVGVNELVLGVQLALRGSPAQAGCTAVDADRDGAVTIDENVAAVARSMSGCFRNQGRDAVEDAARAEQVTRDTLPRLIALNFGVAGGGSGRSLRAGMENRTAPAGGGAGQVIEVPCGRGGAGGGTFRVTCDSATDTRTTTYNQCRFPEEDFTRNGVVRRTVSAPNFDFCTNPIEPEGAMITVVLDQYSQIGASDGIRRSSITQTLVPGRGRCEAGGTIFRDGTLTTDGFVQIYCNPDVDPTCDATLAELRLTARALELRQTYSEPACDLETVVGGKLFIDNLSRQEFFGQTFLGLRMNEGLAGGQRRLSQDGRVLVDCLGEVEYVTRSDLAVDPESPCPSLGVLEIAIRDSTAAFSAVEGSSAAALTAAVQTPPNAMALSGGLEDRAFRAGNGQVYQVLQNPRGNPELRTEDVRITTVVGSPDGISACSSISLGQVDAQAVVSSLPGRALPTGQVFVSNIFEESEPPCFNPGGSDGDGLLCFGAGCGVDCRCPGGACTTFSLDDATALGASDLQGRVVESLPPISGACSGATGRAAYAFGTNTPTSAPGLCAARPTDGFTLEPGQGVVFVYQTALTNEFIAGAAGFPIDVNGDNTRRCPTGSVITGVATQVELSRAVVTFDDGRVDFDVNADEFVERSVPSCQLLSVAECGAPPPPPTPTPRTRPCPETTDPSLPVTGSTEDAINIVGGASCGDGGSDAPEETYRFRAPADGCYRFDTLDTNGLDAPFDTLLYVRRGGDTCLGPEIACNDNGAPDTVASEAFVDLEQGDEVVIIVDGNGGERGDFRLSANRMGPGCAGATPTDTRSPGVTGTPTPTSTSSRTPTRTPTPPFVPVGSEFQIPPGDYSAYFPVVDSDSTGRFVIAWFEYSLDNTFDIFAQRFDSGGETVGTQIQVATYTSLQVLPSVALHEGGDFVIVWQAAPTQDDTYEVFGQRFRSSGQFLGSEFQVNTLTLGDQVTTDVTALTDGGFAVVWTSFSQDGAGGDIFARRYDASGTPVHDEIQVSIATEGNQRLPAVGASPAGGFVVVWRGQGLAGGEIFGRRFDSAGDGIGEEFPVSRGGGDYGSPSITTKAGGEFIVVWDGIIDGPLDMLARRFDSTGRPSGLPFLVNTYTEDIQQNGFRTVATTSDGGFVVAWTSNVSEQGDPYYSQDGYGAGIFAQKFSSSGGRVGTEFQVNMCTYDDQQRPSVAARPNGGFVVVWEGGTLNDTSAVYGQLFATP